MKMTLGLDVPRFDLCKQAQEIGLYSKFVGFHTLCAWYKPMADIQESLLLFADFEAHTQGQLYRAPRRSELCELLRLFDPDLYFDVTYTADLDRVVRICTEMRGEVQTVATMLQDTTAVDAYLTLLIRQYQQTDWSSRTKVCRGLCNYGWSTEYQKLLYLISTDTIVEYYDDDARQHVLCHLDQMFDKMPEAPDIHKEKFHTWCREHQVRFLPPTQTEYSLFPGLETQCQCCEQDAESAVSLCERCFSSVMKNLNVPTSEYQMVLNIESIVQRVCNEFQDPVIQYVHAVSAIASQLGVTVDTKTTVVDPHMIRMELSVCNDRQVLYTRSFDCNVEVKDNTNKKGASYADEAD